MRLAILEVGAPPPELQPRFGDYPAMFERLLGARLSTFKVKQGDWPAIADFDAFIITGSAAGVYEDHPWIEPLKAFLRRARGHAALVGICFGHQIMAEAFGGRVIKSPKGWGVGLNHYQIAAREPWMDDAATIALPASHQDQVVDLPPGARVLAASAFTPYAVLAYDDQPAISFQAHPEFDPAYAIALIESRRGTRYTKAEADAAITSLAAANDSYRVADWITTFLAGVQAPRARSAKV
jgi:GMP synthase-like glutamine amidotransferase